MSAVLRNAEATLDLATAGALAGMPSPFNISASDYTGSVLFHTNGELAAWVKWLEIPEPTPGLGDPTQRWASVERAGVHISLVAVVPDKEQS